MLFRESQKFHYVIYNIGYMKLLNNLDFSTFNLINMQLYTNSFNL